MTFVMRQLNEGKTLGEKLQAMRKAAKLTLSEIAEKTKIQKKYLRAFEEGDYNALPEPLYAKKFLRRFVRELGGDVPYYLQCFEEEYVRSHTPDPEQELTPIKQPRFAISLNRIVKVGTLALVGIGIFVYIGWQINGLVAPPKLIVSTPTDGVITKEATVTISGQADTDATVQINGEPILLHADGSFREDVVLERGLNVITIKGAKRYSKEATVYRRVILDQKTAGQPGRASHIP